MLVDPSFAMLLVAAIFVEALVNTIKPIYDKEKGWQLDRIVSLAIGVLVCGLANIDAFAWAGMAFPIPYVGGVLTGIIASRGSNVVHDLIKLLQTVREGAQISNFRR